MDPSVIPTTITIFEHQWTDGFDWTDRDLRLIERLNRSYGAEVIQAGIRRGRREIQARQYVGVIRLGNRTLQILPKMCRPTLTAQDQLLESTRNLLAILDYTRKIRIHEYDLTSLTQQNADWPEVLTRLFAKNLTAAWRSGALRRYQLHEDEIYVLRGRWRIEKQIQRPDRKHIFYARYDEFTVDNPLNRVLRFVVERLWKITRDAENRRLLHALRMVMNDVTLLPAASSADADPSQLGRFHSSFAPIVGLARLFLDGGMLQILSGSEESYGFVFDMNQLFEEFIAAFLAKHRFEILPPPLQDCDLTPQTSGRRRSLAHHEGWAQFWLKPDIALTDGHGYRVLIDTKYKELQPDDARVGVSQADMYQMYAYARAYDCPNIFLIYPMTDGIAHPIRAKMRLHSGHLVQAATVDLRVPLSRASGRNALIEELRAVLAQPTEENIFPHA